MKESIKSSGTYRLAIKHGLLMTLASVGFFFLMKAFGLEHNLELRALNLIILASFVYAALKTHKKQKGGQLPYLSGISLGLLTSAAGVIPFAVLVFIYVTAVAPEFMTAIKTQEPFGDFLNPVIVSFTIILEGMISGFLVSYASLQYLRPSHMKKRTEVMENQ